MESGFRMSKNACARNCARWYKFVTPYETCGSKLRYLPLLTNLKASPQDKVEARGRRLPVDLWGDSAGSGLLLPWPKYMTTYPRTGYTKKSAQCAERVGLCYVLYVSLKRLLICMWNPECSRTEYDLEPAKTPNHNLRPPGTVLSSCPPQPEDTCRHRVLHHYVLHLSRLPG